MSADISFITYTKGAVMFVTTPNLETQFLNWLNSVSSSAGFIREANSQVGVRCTPAQVHAVEKKNATILRLVEKAAE